MNRREFTENITKLIQVMIADSNQPIIDFAMRSQKEQERLFAAGLSKCDGSIRISDHQYGRAMDIYFVVTTDDGRIYVDYGYEKTADLAEKYHKIWVEMGGKPIIDWDKPHYGAGQDSN